MALRNILDTFKGTQPEGIIGQLDRYLLKLNGKKYVDIPSDRKTGVWHPSSLSTTECIRRLVLTWLNTPASNPDKGGAKSRKIFDVGHHSGYQMQGYFWDMGILEGVYHCVYCKHEWWGISPRECPGCGTNNLELWYTLVYNEVPVNDPERNIWGKADGILNEGGRRRLLELKTIKNRDPETREETITFDELRAAKADHVYQMNLYMHLLTRFGAAIGEGNRIPLGPVKQGIALYNAKNNQKQKEFLIGLIPEFITPMYLRIDQTEHALANGYLPGRISEDKSCSSCMYCPFKGDVCHSDIAFEEADNRNKGDGIKL